MAKIIVHSSPVLLRGPYLQQGASHSIIVRWRQDTPTKGRVVFGKSPSTLSYQTINHTPAIDQVIQLTQLKPNQKYFYAILSESDTLKRPSPNLYFITSPTQEDKTKANVWIIGDSGTGNDNARQVLNAYLNYKASKYTDVWLMLGDNAYGSGTDAQYQSAVFNIYQPILEQTPLWSAFGNHDSYSVDPVTETGPYFDIFSFPENGEVGGVPSGKEAYFSHDYGRIHFISLNTNIQSLEGNADMMKWLQADLEENKSDWLFAYSHHPPYSKGSHNSDIENDLINMRKHILPLLESHGVDLVFSGHSHSYERSFFINGHYGNSTDFSSNPSRYIVNAGNGREYENEVYKKPLNTKKGAVYIVAGSSGKTSWGTFDHPVMFISLKELGSVVLTVDNNRAEIKFLNDKNQIKDWFSLVKGAEFKRHPEKVEFKRSLSSNDYPTKIVELSNFGSEHPGTLTVKVDVPWLNVKLDSSTGPIHITHTLVPEYLPLKSAIATIRLSGSNLIPQSYPVHLTIQPDDDHKKDRFLFKICKKEWNISVTSMGHLWIENTQPLSYDLTLYTPDGRIGKQRRQITPSLQLFQGLPLKPGIYLINLESKTQKKTQWIVIPKM